MNKTRHIPLILIAIMLSSCMTTYPNDVQRVGKTPDALVPKQVTMAGEFSATSTPALSISSTQSPAARLIAAITSGVTITPQPTDTNTLTIPPTTTAQVTGVSTTSVLLSPMVDDEKRLSNLLDLLNTNGSCDLPCWWGISPGQTLWSDAQQFLLSIGANIYTKYEFGKLVHATTNFSEPVIKVSDHQPGSNNNILYFIEKDKFVEEVYINASGWTNPGIFQSHWQSYMPRQILEKYGLPERIRVYTNSILMGNRHGYDLWFIYDTKKFAIRYEGILQIRGNNFEICITNNGQEITEMELFAQAAHLVEPLEEMGGFTTVEYKNTLSIEDAAGIDVSEIYSLLYSDIQNACFKTSIDRWKK